ncbi:MAG: right-handed parallel beta-helix repeat-containing protein [Candidatus Thorarchaeota archaeon]
MIRRGAIASFLVIVVVGLSLLNVAVPARQASVRFLKTTFTEIEFSENNQGTISPSSKKADTSEYTPHSNIVITSNADFAAEASAEGWPGDGSAASPYIISGLEISTTDICIYLKDTNVHFEIRNCFFSSPSTTGTAAVEFYAVSNGKVKDCISDASRGGPGFFLSQSSNNVLINNTVNGNSNGFEVTQSSHDNTLTGNTVISSSRGFSIRESNNCRLIGNTATDNQWSGYRLTECFNTTVANNTSAGNTLFGFSLRDCTNNTISNNTSTNNGYSGFTMSHSSNHNTLTENSAISNSANGFFVYGETSYNTFTSNIIAFNSDEGIDLSSSASSNNTFFLNVFYDNGGVNARDDGANNTWDDGASSGNYWGDYDGGWFLCHSWWCRESRPVSL